MGKTALYLLLNTHRHDSVTQKQQSEASITIELASDRMKQATPRHTGNMAKGRGVSRTPRCSLFEGTHVVLYDNTLWN